jgi:methylmalonyl-CoA/ethylmalonyl-CoA epimerase
MSAVTGLKQVALSVGDLERSKIFYGETLGLPHLFDAPPALAFFTCGETRLMLSQAENPESGGPIILYYGTADVSAAYEGLVGAGAEAVEPPRCIAQVDGADVWLAFCRDPDGHPVGLITA